MEGEVVEQIAVNAEMDALQAVVDRALEDRGAITVLDAGCGATTALSFRQPARFVGIDTSARQLERHSLLHEKILGDIQTHSFAADSFDVVVAWQVLEHVPSPERALEHFRDALRDGGLLILSVPNVLSVKGLVTKFTPHSFHVWAYRRLFGMENAGIDDNAPFPTYLRFSIRQSRLLRFAQENGFSVEYFHSFEWHVQTELRKRIHLVGRAWWLLRSLVRILTAGRVDAERTDFTVVLRKGSRAAASSPRGRAGASTV
jgi:SAM-dependent methyltransferase